MGMMLGKVTVETPEYSVVSRGDGYEVREYAGNIVAEVTYEESQSRNAGFMVLANYIGALGKPNNVKIAGGGEKIAMTAPVLTKQGETGEKIAMTAPVLIKQGEDGEKIAMTAPVLMQAGEDGEKGKMMTMAFVLPSKYKSLEEVPRPTDPRVSVKEVGASKYGVVTFSGIADEKLEQTKLRFLKESLEKAGFHVSGSHILAQYNPPWTIPAFRTNEIWLPVS